MPATLTTLTDRIELILDDVANTKFTTTEIEEGIRQALHHYSRKKPLKAITTLNISTTSREISISSITGLLTVCEVWLPYTSADPEEPPNKRHFDHWRDEAKLYFSYEKNGGFEPASGTVARIFYTKLHTLNGLDSAATTTVHLEDETALAIGASGYAVLAYSRAAADKVNVEAPTQVSEQTMKWAHGQIRKFGRMIKPLSFEKWA